MAATNDPEMKAQIIYFSHGGGPLPILGDPGHRAMVEFMKALPRRLRAPEAILVLSAHWEESEASISSAQKPELFYDYYGFPEEAYAIDYPVPGSPHLAKRIAALLSDAGIPSRLDPERGLDHGLFIPLKLMYPDASIPAIQLSLLSGLDPAAHLRLGAALKPLLEDRLLVIGSGFSFHNLRAFDWSGSAKADPRNEAFQDWLVETCAGDVSQAEREGRLLEWEKAPGARYAHPREEHLLPLHICAALASRRAELVYDDLILGKRSIALLWS